MSSAGRVGSSNGCATKPKGRGIGLRSCVVQIRSSSLTASCVMETAEQQEPYESRGSRTVLGEPGGESPPGHSTNRGRKNCICNRRASLSNRAKLKLHCAETAANRLAQSHKGEEFTSGNCTVFPLTEMVVESISSAGFW